MLELNCLRLGDPPGRAFPVKIDGEKTVSYLRKMIKEEKKPEFDHLAADWLKLSLVSIPYSDIKAPTQDLMNVKSRPIVPPLTLNHFFPEPPNPFRIHVLVETPPMAESVSQKRVSPPAMEEDDHVPKKRSIEKKSDFTPPGSRINGDALRLKINEVLEVVGPTIAEFLKNPHPPFWQPKHSNMHSEDRRFFEELRLPTVADEPSLLLHELWNHGSAQADAIFGDGSHRIVCNTSGSGKTRRLLEGLTKYWGLYFVTRVDPLEIGVPDLQMALETIRQHEDWVEDLTSLPSNAQLSQQRTNERIASRYIMGVLVARVLIFQQFLEKAREIDGELTEWHKHAWVVFQLSNWLVPGHTMEHPFLQMQCSLRSAQTKALIELLAEFYQKCPTFYTSKHFFIVFDEAQVANRWAPNAFLSQDPKQPQSILKEIIRTCRIVNIGSLRFIISGTSFSFNSLEELVTSGVGKMGYDLDVFHDLGSFDTKLSLEAYMKRYLPPSFWQSDMSDSLVRRIEIYLCGRHRFLAGYLQLLLKDGLASPHRLLDCYIKALAGYVPNDVPSAVYGNELAVREPIIRGFEWNRLKEDDVALRQAQDIVQSHLTRKATPSYGPTIIHLVEYGLARLRDGRVGYIDEPLAFASLYHWFEANGFSLMHSLLPRLANPESRGYAFEEMILLYLSKTLSTFVPLCSLFEFPKPPPTWASQKAKLVIQAGSGQFITFNQLAEVCCPRNVSELIEWVTQGAPLRPAFAFALPGDRFGPDLMAWIEREDGSRMLLMVQDKSHTTGNKDSMNSTALSKAIRSFVPDHWFKDASLADRRKLVDVMKGLDILCLIAGYPLSPLEGSTAKSVIDARNQLPSRVTYATLNIDTFRMMFRAENEGTGTKLLESLDSARAHAGTNY